MKKPVVLITVLLAVLLLALPVLAQGNVTVKTGYNLALRACADRTSEDFATVPFDTTLAATALSTDRNWVAVNYNGQPGWLTLQYTSVESGRLGDLPISGQCFQRGGGGGGVTSPVNVRMNINLRYRTNPTLDERPAGAIPYQAEVPALAVSSDSNFVMVNYQGQNVWVWREYVTVTTGSLSQFVPGAAPIAGGAAPAPAVPSTDLRIGSSISGNISGGAPAADYTLALNAGDVVSIAMTRTSGNLDCFLILYAPGGAEVASDDDGGGGLNSLITYTAPTTGVYVVRATRYSGLATSFTNSTGGFQLAVSGAGAAAPAAGAGPAPAAPATGARSGIFVAIDGTNAAHGWNNGVPGDLRASSFATARIIAYVRENNNVVETCTYNVFVNGVPSGQVGMNRIKVQYTIRLVDAATGAQIDERGFEGNEPEVCPDNVSGGRRDFYSYPTIEQALDWFRERVNG